MTKNTKEEVIEVLHSVAQSLGTDVLTQREFFANTDVTISEVLRYFPKWSDACRAAGVDSDKSRDKVPDEEVLANWGIVTRNLGRIPSLREYRVFGKYARNVFDRFGKWADIPDAFKKHFADSEGWLDVFAILEQNQSISLGKKTVPKGKTHHAGALKRLNPKLENRPIYGDPIDFRGLRHEPVNEQGVVFLFGMVARELGYLVEAIQAGYPDCEAKRQIARGQWQPVRIEFEYLSRNFVDHSHDPEQCDVIVCWIHNWTECPDEIEVLELSDEIKKLII